ncbi:MAG: hypothetical protein LBT46_13935 [Planctomycetaceae bacterium]|nr:hypothetical protein [Planctomycetaceae bacterium]
MRQFCFSFYFILLFGIPAASISAQDNGVSNHFDTSVPKAAFAPLPAPVEQAAAAHQTSAGTPPKSFDIALDSAGFGDAPLPVTAVPALTSEPAPAVAEVNPLTARQMTDAAQRHQPSNRQKPDLSSPLPVPSPSITHSRPVDNSVTHSNSVTHNNFVTNTAEAASVLASQPADHPLARYLGLPNEAGSTITGKPLSVEELLNGTRSAAARSRLLQVYWELSGKLTAYHIQHNLNAARPAAVRIAELEFIKAQWNTADKIRQYKNIDCNENELPIPTDYPLYQRYETFADQIARTDRTEYLARLIPIQEQLIEAKLQSQQRIEDLLDLTQSVTDYNKMIAEYAALTVSVNADNAVIVGAVIKVPKRESTQRQIIRQTSYTR